MRIFLAEDNLADVWLIEEALRRHSVEYQLEHYLTAEDAANAASRCGEEGPIPDIMILDFNLPRGHGIDVLSAAAGNPYLSAVPKVIVTSSLRPAEATLAESIGATCVLMKPSNFADFVSEVGSKVISMARGGDIASR